MRVRMHETVNLLVAHGHLAIVMVVVHGWIHGRFESAQWIRTFSISVSSGRRDRPFSVTL